ncbi:MAG: serpin family protein [Candidatus Eisenbacteria sp.]|nr:serpin family protein [Candidatus Eisenbacteria bacterium]
MRFSSTSVLLLASLSVLLLTACESADPVGSKNNGGDGVVTPEAFAERVSATNELAFNLYHRLAGGDDNLMVSPHSIAVAFATVYAGARSTTEEEIAEALCFPCPQGGFHSAMQALNDSLTSRGRDQGADVFKLNIANSCWGDEDWHYEQAYLDTLARFYGAPMRLVDLAGQPEQARLAINQWMADQTEDRVPELIPPGALCGGSYLVLANAIYFRACWLKQFKTEYTHDEGFMLLDGTTIQVPTMTGMDEFDYCSGDGYRAVDLAYVGEQVSMLAVLPDSGQFAAFEAGFDEARLEEIQAQLVPTDIFIQLPRFSFETPLDLKETLTAMGMTEAFGVGADFTGMDGTDDGMPWINGVWHRTFISVDEYGTEAAAGTGIEMYLSIMPYFSADRPFLFVICDRPTGTVLFMGRVLDPRG